MCVVICYIFRIVVDRMALRRHGACSDSPLTTTEHRAGPWGLVRVRKPNIQEQTMVRPADLPISPTLSKDGGTDVVPVCTSSPPATELDLQIEYLPPERLHSAPTNARKHSKKQLKKIAQSIGRFGFLNPVLISDDLEIIAGHGRVAAAEMLGLRQIPAVRLSKLSAAERRAYVIADNRLAELAGWDREILASELGALCDLNFDDVEATGFSLEQIDVILEAATEKPQHRAEGELQPSGVGLAVCRTGDVWLLGQHRLCCGEASCDCDAVVRRWQQYSGKHARLEGSGLSFADVAAARRQEQKASAKAAHGRK